ncbi:MAG TPA: zf-HC2 domain-containing protein [Pyrinomonadaceae bacterium]|jgi:hypothetical protein
MKQANNNEVDLLLRSLARQRDKSGSQNGSSFEDGREGLSEHLDADELNSYAEGVVPAPARLRYQEHLADCESCRRIVIDLSQAAGAAARYEVAQPQSGSGFWEKILVLFSPAVLKFAVPALVLTAVVGIGLFAVRQQQPNDMIAQQTNVASPPAGIEPQNPSQSQTNAVNPSASVTPLSGSSNPDAFDDGRTTAVDKNLQGEKSPTRGVPLDSVVAKSTAGKDAAPAGDGAGAGIITTQPYAAEPKADAPPAPITLGATEKSAEVAKEQKREDLDRSRDEFRNQVDEEHGPSRSRNNAQLPASQRNAGIMTQRGPNAVDKKKAGAVESRSISGRRFTRADNVWIDTDYNPPQATTRIARGSDQFRALVADEPGIKAIADQLSGPVIVVWKSRAYRIQ